MVVITDSSQNQLQLRVNGGSNMAVMPAGCNRNKKSLTYVIGPSSSTVLICLPASSLGQTQYTVRCLSHYLKANSLALFMFTNFLQTLPLDMQPCCELLAASSMWASIRKGEE